MWKPAGVPAVPGAETGRPLLHPHRRGSQGLWSHAARAGFRRELRHPPGRPDPASNHGWRSRCDNPWRGCRCELHVRRARCNLHGLAGRWTLFVPAIRMAGRGFSGTWSHRPMTDGRSWQGSWKARLYERVRERGYDSLTAFAESRPAVPLDQLAEELGKDDVAGVQVLSGLLAEAERRKQVTRFVRDVLVRQLSESIPGGWPAEMDRASSFAVATALGCWYADTPETHTCPTASPPLRGEGMRSPRCMDPTGRAGH